MTTTTTTTITDAVRAAIAWISIDRQSFADCIKRPDGSIDPEDAPILRKYDDVLAQLHAALVAADHDAALLNAAQDLLAESEEYEFDDGLGRGAPQQYWDALQDALEFGDDE